VKITVSYTILFKVLVRQSENSMLRFVSLNLPMNASTSHSDACLNRIQNTMSTHTLAIESITHITHDVLRICTNKPVGFEFVPGQAANISINKKGWVQKERPFTFTSLPTNNTLEFTIKTYPGKEHVTNKLLELKPQDALIMHEVFGTIQYVGSGVFIAGGAGVTPFISIFRNLKEKNEIGTNGLLFANKTKEDIILESEFEELLGDAFINILSEERMAGYDFGRITEDFLAKNIHDFKQQFYVCGPPPMIKEVEHQLENLGVAKNNITKELF